MSLSYTSILAGASGQSSGYSIPYSARFNSADSAYLTFTPGSVGNRRTFTAIATWFVRVKPGADLVLLSTGTDGNNYETIYVRSDDKIEVQGLTGGVVIYNYRTPEVRRDPSGCYHLVVAFDTTQATASNRVKIYVNGVQIAYSTFTNVTDVAQNTDSRFNNTVAHSIGRFQATASSYADTYLSQTAVLINASQLAGTNFVEFDAYGNCIAKDVTTITRGTNGALLDFSNSASLGQDQGAGTNDWTSSGLTSADQVTSTPSNVFAVWNPIDKNSAITLADGNLVASGSDAADEAVAATMAFASGKWVACAKAGGIGALRFGVTSRSVWQADTDRADISGLAQARAFNLTAATTWSVRAGGGTALSGNLGFTFVAADDYVVAAFDVDAAKLWFGAYDASAATLYWYDSAGTRRTSDEPGLGTNATFSSITTAGGLTLFSEPQAAAVSCTLFTGAGVWPITTPANFNQMCTSNLPAPAIPDGSAHFQPTLYTGNNSTQSVNQSGNSTFEPGLAWIKDRTVASTARIYDVIRGVNKSLIPSSTGAENSDTNFLNSFNSNGFSVGNGGSHLSATGSSYVAWQWKAGGAGVNNTSGSITSTVSANPTAGFSIVTWTGTGANATVGHGLGVAPKMIIVKERSPGGDDWYVYHASLTSADYYVMLNRTTAQGSGSMWNNTAPTSSVFSLTSYIGANASGSTYVAYCFAPIAGFSAFGSYTGNGSADGPFIYTGFKPAWVMWKNASAAATSWLIKDTSRDTYNVMTTRLFAENTNADDVNTSNDLIDYVSNGFKIRSAANAQTNGSGNTIIYAAFASNPFGGSGAAPATAR